MSSTDSAREGAILVLGAAGMLGGALVRLLRRRGRRCDAPPRARADLLDLPALVARIERTRPGALINAAAFSDVAAAERPERRDELFRVNRDAPAALASACRDRGVRFVFLSTDFVFDGASDRPYREDDPTGPLQLYGRSKLEGERAVLEADPAVLVVRTSTLFGPGLRARPHYVDAVLDQARRGSTIAVVRHPTASPTYAPDLAEAIVGLLDRGARGVVHATNSGGCSRLELARAAVELAFPGGAVTVTERAEAPEGPRRPRYAVLDVTRLTSWLGREPRGWRAALAEYVATRGRA